jgi:predicted transcriptional regulator
MQTLCTSEQLRRARNELQWSPEALAKRARVPVALVKRLESLDGPLDAGAKIERIRALQAALEKAGVRFPEG